MVRGDYYWRAGFAPLRWVSLVVGFGLAAGVGYENYLNRDSHFGLYFLTVRSLLALVLAAAALCGVRRPLLAGFLYFVAGGFVLLSGAFFGSGMVAVAALVAVLLAILIVAGASRPASRAGTSTANHTVERS